jgi:hypothetical protein
VCVTALLGLRLHTAGYCRGDLKGGALWDRGTHINGPAALPAQKHKNQKARGRGRASIDGRRSGGCKNKGAILRKWSNGVILREGPCGTGGPISMGPPNHLIAIFNFVFQLNIINWPVAVF